MGKLVNLCLVNLLLLAAANARSLTEESESGSKKGYTCLYNGVEYKEGDELPTRGKCWHCTCREGFTEPGPELCARISCPTVQKPGCEPVYDKNECCPVTWKCGNTSSSAHESATCKCETNYFKHYEIKNCKPVLEEGCDCPVRFDCPTTFLENNEVCYYNGKTYKVKDSIETSNPCEICSCEVSHFQPGVRISCISVECPSAFRPTPLLSDDCYEIYALDHCCTIGQKCDNTTVVNGTEISEPTCELDGKIYHLGQMIYPKDNPCLICVCDEQWTGPSSKSCRVQECMLEKHKHDLQEGCLPIYHEGLCCPIEFHCVTSEEEVKPSNRSVSFTAKKEDPLMQCTFGGKKYNFGDVLDIKHPTSCVTCTCSTPPEFTCVHKSCPEPSGLDRDTCQTVFVDGECCPRYECVQAAVPICDPLYCPVGCSEIAVPYGCSMCLCDDILCSTPKCGPDCILDYNASPCPACRCVETIPLDRPMCGPVKCGPQCHEAISPQGCPMCVCGPLCSPPKCGPNCQVQTNVDEGECPNCVCYYPDLPEEDAHKTLCSPVKCPSYCSEATSSDGCPTCLCEPLCSPPNCDPGCRAEVVPSSGPCPGCVCDRQDEKSSILRCAPVKCPPGCTEQIIPNGCSICKCQDVLCSLPNCPAGCEVNYEVPPGSCPQCKCPPTIPLDRPICDPVKCGPQCYEAVSPQGCPMCICGPLCSVPKCDLGCHLQVDVPEGQCPGCDCPGDRSVLDQFPQMMCSPVKCPPECSEASGPNGCPMCLCQPLCTPPKCDPGCQPEIAPSSGPCPTCVCNRRDIRCSPVHCGPDCYQTVNPLGCPKCVCRPQCSPPRCPVGCVIQQNVPEGLCPGCDCPTLGQAVPEIAPLQMSAPIKCPDFCRAVINRDGTPGCICEAPPLCSPPKCAPGCRVQSIPTEGPCPGCVCDNSETEFRWCPPVKCEEGCVEVVVQDRCPTCKCGDKCAPVKCPESCALETAFPPDACPECKCPYDKPKKLDCPDIPCELPCQKTKLTPDSCPVCDCIMQPAKGVIPPSITG